MEYIMELRWNDDIYDAQIHLVTTIIGNAEESVNKFLSEFSSALDRSGIKLYYSNILRIDNNDELKKTQLIHYENFLKNVTAKIKVEEFILKSPEQDKNLWNNLIKRFREGKDSTALIGKEYHLPVRIRDRETNRPVDIFYYNLEVLRSS